MARQRRQPKPYTMPTSAVGAATEDLDRGAAMAFFLLENTGSVCGRWSGVLKAADQRLLFGQFIGKGYFYVDGDTELVRMYVKVAFGTDSDCRFMANWWGLLHGQPPVARNDRVMAARG